MIDIWNRPNPDPDYTVNQAVRVRWFDQIAPKSNWKGPIDAWIRADQFEQCNKAALFFTGAPIERVTTLAIGGKVRIVGVGYYAAVGA